MIIEQIRYYVADDDREALIALRREVTRLREGAGVPVGRLLLADPSPDEGPSLVWQCGYRDEGELAMAETALLASPDYIAARERIAGVTLKVELELYTAEDEGSLLSADIPQSPA